MPNYSPSMICRTPEEVRSLRVARVRMKLWRMLSAITFVVLVGGLGLAGLWAPSLVIDETCPAGSTMLVPDDDAGDPGGLGLPGAAGDGTMPMKRVPGCRGSNWSYLAFVTAFLGGAAGLAAARSITEKYPTHRWPQWYYERIDELDDRHRKRNDKAT